MTFTFTLTKRAHWHALRAVTTRTVGYKLGWIFFGGSPVLILGMAVATGRGILDTILASPLAILAGPLLMLVGFPLLHYWTVTSFHKKNELLRHPQTVQLTPTHLVMRGPLHSAEITWQAVHQVVETRHCILFYVAKGLAHFLPIEAVSSAELPIVRQRLNDWLPGRARLRSAH